jgi:myo-inositol-1(or 4)-monophosphatase
MTPLPPTPLPLADMAETAIEAARRAGALVAEGLRSDRAELSIEHKGEVDLVTSVDLAAEAAIVELVRARFPDHLVLAEEAGADGPWSERSRTRPLWVIDPLDGTTNFAHGHPQVGISIACVDEAGPLLGVVLDPVRDELFSVRRGEGSKLNGRPIAVSREASLSRSLLATGFGYDRRQRADYYTQILARFLEVSQGVRRQGAACLDLAWVACGRYDGFWEAGLKPWDVAAGLFLVESAGGRVSDYRGGPVEVSAPTHIVATNGRIHEACLAVLERAKAV